MGHGRASGIKFPMRKRGHLYPSMYLHTTNPFRVYLCGRPFTHAIKRIMQSYFWVTSIKSFIAFEVERKSHSNANMKDNKGAAFEWKVRVLDTTWKSQTDLTEIVDTRWNMHDDWRPRSRSWRVVHNSSTREEFSDKMSGMNRTW